MKYIVIERTLGWLGIILMAVSLWNIGEGRIYLFGVGVVLVGVAIIIHSVDAYKEEDLK